MNKKGISLLFILLSFHSFSSQANPGLTGLYAGIMGGYGSTTWDGLVPEDDQQNLALNLSTPTDSREGGGVWGVFVGYEFLPSFALEANYVHYPHATIWFDEMSLFTFERDGLMEFSSETETVNLLAKIMLTFSQSKIRVYSGFGVASVHRKDILIDSWNMSPSFSVGANYPITERLRFDVDVNYTAGYGEARLCPTDTYIPFLYYAGARLAFLF